MIRTAADLTSTLLTHHIAVKLETILDREANITHEVFAAQIETRLGSGEGETAKGPDMRVWSKGRRLNDVSIIIGLASSHSKAHRFIYRLTGRLRSCATLL
jgi:hypothetical protein